MNNPNGQLTLKEQDEMLDAIEDMSEKLMAEWNVDVSNLNDDGQSLYSAYDEIGESVLWAKEMLYQIKRERS